jgi:uncharacterized protein YbaR (Trm112 family)
MISPDLLAILVCPECKNPFQPYAGNDHLDCYVCNLAFPIRNDIPMLLASEAERIDPASKMTC